MINTIATLLLLKQALYTSNGHKGTSLTHVFGGSGIKCIHFIESLSTIQGMLMKSGDSAKNVKLKGSPGTFDCSPLPLYIPSCRHCSKNGYECTQLHGSIKCASCYLRKKTCNRDNIGVVEGAQKYLHLCLA